jgi:hypothetical protein
MAKSSKVTVYIRVPGTRERVRANIKNTIATGTVFCLRYVRAGQRVWETLNVSSFACRERMVARVRTSGMKIRNDKGQVNRDRRQRESLIGIGF